MTIRRTTDGIPHISATNWYDLGRGIGFAQAQDTLCTLAEGFVTYAGQRSLYFDPDERPAFQSSLAKATNRELDFFFTAFVGERAIRPYQEQLPEKLRLLVAGFANGYNHYLEEVRNRASIERMHGCVNETWLRKISEQDIYRRFYAAQLAGGQGHFIPELVAASRASDNRELGQKARVQAASVAPAPLPDAQESLSRRLLARVGEDPSLGSNALALGSEATGEQNAVLFGNPHWYWSGPDRFYQMQLTIPGQLNVAGASLLGVPLIMIGFNENVAWTHTVSTARRASLFQLALDAKNPEAYLVDGKSSVLQRQSVQISLRDKKGELIREKRLFYTSLFGPLIDLSAWNPALAKRGSTVFTIQDINTHNYRLFAQFLAWNQASSLDEFVAIQKREIAMPWVNTLAIGRNDGRVWYADIGAVPNISDAFRARCSANLAKVVAQLDPITPVLDGSRLACQWWPQGGSIREAQLPLARLPSLWRKDYVANMNNSYWFSNPKQVLEGYDSLLGGETQPLSGRAKLGHQIALNQLKQPSSSAEQLSQRLRQAVLTPTAYSALENKVAILHLLCGQTLDLQQSTLSPDQVKRTCETLTHWNNQANPADTGALLWERLWPRLEQGLREKAGSAAFAIAFDPRNPLNTPAQAQWDQALLIRALEEVLLELTQTKQAINQALAEQRVVQSGVERIALFGGCDEFGYYVVFCTRQSTDQQPVIQGNSYLQMVHFNQQGVQAYTLLAHGQDEKALLPYSIEGVNQQAMSAPIQRYAQKQWLLFPFTEAQIHQDPQLTRTILW